MNSIPKGNQEDMKLLTTAFDYIAEYLEKSSNVYKRTGVEWIMDKLQQFTEDENAFMDELTKWKHGFNKRYNTREKERISYKGLQERGNEKNYTRTRRNPVDESSRCSEHLEEYTNGLRSDQEDITADTDAAAHDVLSTPQNFDSKSNNGFLTPPNSSKKP